jgi:tetraacyldisaccharide 4'-kinase
MATGEPGLVAAWYRGAWWLWLLRPFEFFFRAVVLLRRALYRHCVLASYTAEKPVVVVGNITVGGTGKTPIVVALVEHLQSQGLRPGVVSRGYGSDRQTLHTVHSLSTAQDCGDEALLIYQRTGCPCVTAPARPAAVQHLLREFPVDIVLSDDGLQHYALGRSMEIAVLDQARGIGNGFCLPAGPLREPAGRLESVDYVLYRGSDDPDQGVCYTTVALVNLVSREERPVTPASLQKDIHAVAGIGQPRQFFASLRKLGFELETHSFADHHEYLAEDLSGLADKPIIMTEKDAVKCREIAGDNAWYLKISALIPQSVRQSVAALVHKTRE